MSQLPAELKYRETHEWARKEANGMIAVGITDHAQDALGDVVYVELPQPGDRVTAGEPLGVVESVKAASDIYAPIDGTVTEVNEALTDAPEQVNQDSYGAWFCRIEPADAQALDGLWDAADYAASIAREGG